MRSEITTLIACSALAACVACSRQADSQKGAADQQGDRASTTAEQHSTAAEANRQMTLEGCLQRGGGTFSNGFMLTTLSEPAGVATSGSVTASGSAVEREQLRAAAHSYRLDPKGDVNLADMVGRRVRITGTMAESANIPNGTGRIGSGDDPQRPDVGSKKPDIHMDSTDLAKLDVTSASVVADSCGNGSDRSNGAGPTGGAAHR